MADVHELVERAKAGDRQAFTGLYDQFAPLVRSVAYDTTGSLHEAEDLCQDVFLQAYRNLGQLRDATLRRLARDDCAPGVCQLAAHATAAGRSGHRGPRNAL